MASCVLLSISQMAMTKHLNFSSLVFLIATLAVFESRLPGQVQPPTPKPDGASLKARTEPIKAEDGLPGGCSLSLNASAARASKQAWR